MAKQSVTETAQEGPAGQVPVAAAPRRDILRWAGLGVLTVAVAGTGVLSYQAHGNQVLGADRGKPFDPWRYWRDDPGPAGPIAAAILAASPHNTQPWLFRSSEGRIDVYADASRQMRTVDPYSREMNVGLGCAVENLVLAAAARGFAPTVALLPDPADAALVARVTLASGRPSASPLYDAIGTRHTNRGPYRDVPMPDAVLAELAELVDDATVSVVWISEAESRRQLGELMIEAAQAVTDDAEMSRDGFGWFRSDAGAIAEHRDGLTLDGQGLSPLITSVAKLMPPSSREYGDRFWVDQTRKVHTSTAAAYGLILVADPHDQAQQLRGGRVLERIHLAVTAKGLALQHMNQITERIDRDLSLGREPVLGPRLAALVNSPDRQVLTTFRLGYPSAAGRQTPRRSVPEVLR